MAIQNCAYGSRSGSTFIGGPLLLLKTNEIKNRNLEKGKKWEKKLITGYTAVSISQKH